MKINNFWGELTDISAKKEAVGGTVLLYRDSLFAGWQATHVPCQELGRDVSCCEYYHSSKSCHPFVVVCCMPNGDGLTLPLHTQLRLLLDRSSDMQDLRCSRR